MTPREQASTERWIAVVRLAVVPFLLVQLLLVPPASSPVMLGVATAFALTSVVVLSLYVRHPTALARPGVRVAIFAADCVAFTVALADYAGPGDLTWVTFILVLLTATVRWDARGAIASVVVFALADLPLDIGTPAWTRLTLNAGSVTFKMGLISLLAFFFGTQFRSFRRMAFEHQQQAEALRQKTDTLLRSEGQLRVVFDSALMGLITMDQDGIVQDWNDQAEAMFGWSKAEVAGHRLSETIIPEPHRAAHETGLAHFRRTGQGRVLGHALEITALNRKGDEFPVELNISPTSPVDGRTTFVAFIRDIRESKREEALRLLQLGVTRTLSDALSLEEAAPLVLEELGRRLDLALAQWWEVAPGGDRLSWKDSWFAQGLQAVDFIDDSQSLTFAPGDGFLGRAWASGQATVVPDLAAEPDFRRRQTATAARLRGAVALPVLSGLEVTGVIELYTVGERTFAEDELKAMASIGSQLGQFVQRRRAEDSLQATGQRITAVLENIADGIVTVDAQGCLQSLNGAARRLFGYLPDQLIGASVETLVAEGERGELTRRLLNAQGAEGRLEGAALETTGRRVDGGTFPLEARASEMSLSGQRVYIVSLRDISDRRAQTDALEYQALHDALTGLPNRSLLQDRLSQSIAAATRDERPLALILLDLDRFKEVNDTMGHAYGDLLLQQAATRIRELLREADTVARLGGDEFAVLPTGATGREAAIQTAQKVATAFDRPFVIDDRTFDIRASMGIALFPEHGADAETLMRRADVAMYVAKRAKKPYQLYDPSHDADTAMRLALMSELRHAPANGEMVLHYQPKVDLRSDRVVGVEALLRWAHPQRGMLGPDQFISLAEQTETINVVTRWVLDAALRQLHEWRESGLDIAMAVNMSARNLHDPELPGVVADLLSTWRVPAEMLTVEVTEGVAMDSTAEERLLQLRALGVGLCIDDFGTGYSSLAYLKHLPMDEIKIDRSFVTGMDTNADDAAIVRSTIDLGHNLGLRVVAEGVENEAALQMLRAYGCDFAQGYHLSPALGAEQAGEWIRCRQPTEAASPD